MKHYLHTSILSTSARFGTSCHSPILKFSLFFTLLLGATFANAATINVPADQATIQAAVNAAAPGDIIIVAPGTYNENVTINKSLTLRSSGGRGSTFINGTAGTNGTVVIAASNVTVGGVGNQGFTITGFDGTPGSETAAVYVQGVQSNIIVRGNEIKAAGDGAFLTEYGNAFDNLTVEGNIFSGQTFLGNEPGGCGFGSQFTTPNVPRVLVYIANGTNLLFSNNTITGTAGGTSTDPNCSAFGQGNTLVTIFGNSTPSSNATICGNTFMGTTSRFGVSLDARGTNVSIKNNTFSSAGLMNGATYHIDIRSTTLTGANPGTIEGVANMNIFTPEGYYTSGGLKIFKNSTQAGSGAIAANSAQIANTSCPTCLGTEAPNLFTAYPGDARVPAGQQSASVCQNSGNVIFQFSNCQGGTVNWSGTNGSMGNGNIVATSATVGTVTYSATCTQGECTSEASTVSVTTNAPPTVSISGNTSVIFGFGSNCTTLTANPVGTAPFTYSWKMGNTQIGTSANQQVCPESTTTYFVTVTDANGCSATKEVTVNVKDVRCGNKNQNVTICYYGVTQCVSEKIAERYLKLGATIGACGSGNARIGVEETALDSPFELSVKGYPNPTQGVLTVEVISRITGPAQMQVLDLTGRPVQQRSEQLLEGLNEVKFDLTAQPSGTYLIRATDGQNRQGVIRVSKQ